MSDINQLKQALGIKEDVAKVMRVVSVTDGKTRLEAEGVVLVLDGSWMVGTQLVVRSGNVESIVSEAVSTIFID